MAIAHTILALAVSRAALGGPARAQEQETPAPPTNKWSFAGPFGKYDLSASDVHSTFQHVVAGIICGQAT
jgi:hypothetical protein